jgi:DNA repair exonuclease SbcCD ATPase subunit
MMTAIKIRAWNFRSFRQLAYTITPAGLVAVEGMYEGTQDRSNGAGKSTFLPEILCWAIYGETTNGKKQVCSTYEGAEEVRVEVELPFISWARTQQRDGTGNQIEIDGVRGYEVQKAQLLKQFPPKRVFCSTLILGQGLGEGFTSWTPAVRAQALSELLSLSVWAEARKKLSGDRTLLKTQLDQATGAMATWEQQYNELKAKPEGDPSKRQAAAAKVAKISGELQKLQTEYSTVNQETVGSARLLGQWNAEIQQYRREIDNCRREAAGLRAGVKCPTCQRPYPKSSIADMAAAIKERERIVTNKMDAIQAEYGPLQKSSVANQKKLDRLAPRISKLRDEHMAALTALNATQSHAEQLRKAEEGYASARETAEDFVTSLEDLALLDRAFLEIPIWKIDGVLGSVNERLVEVCNTIWESEFLVQLTSEQGLKKGGAKAAIGLVVHNKAGDYKGSSPGQQRKIDITIQLAIRELLMSAWPNALPLLVCDDVVDVLDPWAKRTFYKNYLMPAAQRSAVFVLTPQSEYPVPVSRKVLVQYTEEAGSWVSQSTAAPVVEFHG